MTRPPMPWFNVRAMTDADLRGLYQYVKSLRAGGAAAPAFLPPDKATETAVHSVARREVERRPHGSAFLGEALRKKSVRGRTPLLSRGGVARSAGVVLVKEPRSAPLENRHAPRIQNGGLRRHL
jgi:hypothetical protein